MSRSDTRIVGDRSVTFRHQDSKMNEYWGDWSVTFRHQDSKENESWIMLIYSDLKNLFPKWVWCGGLSPHRCAWVVPKGYGTCFCHLLSVMVDFMLLSDIYCFLFWVCRWYLLSTCALYWPLLVCFSLLFVECSKRIIDFDSSSTLASLHHVRFQVELLFLARTGFSLIHVLMSLKFGHGPFVYLI